MEKDEFVAWAKRMSTNEHEFMLIFGMREKAKEVSQHDPVLADIINELAEKHVEFGDYLRTRVK